MSFIQHISSGYRYCSASFLQEDVMPLNSIQLQFSFEPPGEGFVYTWLLFETTCPELGQLILGFGDYCGSEGEEVEVPAISAKLLQNPDWIYLLPPICV